MQCCCMFYRRECLRIPDSLPKLLAAVKWNSRDDVSQVGLLMTGEFYLLPVSRTTRVIGADIGDNLLPSLTFPRRLSDCCWRLGWPSLLSDVIFPSFLFHGNVPCEIFLLRRLNLTTCPKHRNSIVSHLLISLRKDRWLFVLYFMMWE